MEKIIINANSSKLNLGLKDLYRYKDLFFTLAYRDFRVRYVQTFLGVSWSFVKPVLMIMIFVLLFRKGLNLSTGDLPYPLFAITGLTVWNYFSTVMSQAGVSIIASQAMIQKIYFPRLVIPLSKSLSSFLDYIVGLILFVVLMFYYKYPVSKEIIYFPIFFLISVISALGVGIWFSALSIRYRDFQQIIPFIIRFGVLITPVAYPAEIVIKKIPKWAGVLYYLNPMAGVIDGIRWSLTGGEPPGSLAYISFGAIMAIFFTSLIYFKKIEKTIADII